MPSIKKMLADAGMTLDPVTPEDSMKFMGLDGSRPYRTPYNTGDHLDDLPPGALGAPIEARKLEYRQMRLLKWPENGRIN